jgi:hypothetical protein
VLGRAAVAMWWEVPPEVRTEWEDWHTREHMPERAAIPGFLRGTRWAADSGEASYFVCYEAEDLKTLTTGAYVERLNHPTPWSQKMMPYHRNMVRSLCRVHASSGLGLGGVAATIRFSPSRASMPALPERKGITSAHLLESLPASGIPQTAEQRIRGGDAHADWVLFVCGYHVDAVRPTAAELALPGATAGLYRLAYSITPKDLPR